MRDISIGDETLKALRRLTARHLELDPIGEPQHRGKNFAVWFPFYDVMFGTAHRPKRGEYPQTGVAGVEVGTLSAAVMLPFARWWQMAKSARR